MYECRLFGVLKITSEEELLDSMGLNYLMMLLVMAMLVIVFTVNHP